MNDTMQRKDRRAFLIGGVLAISTAGLAGAGQAAASAKAAKSDFFYQDKPKDGKSCATCRMFNPADGTKGSCAVVEGDVNASGWCLAYSPR
jgi:hypothetical protein